ncbi:hypothetical protein ACS4RR_009915 [Rhizobium sp. Z1P35]
MATDWDGLSLEDRKQRFEEKKWEDEKQFRQRGPDWTSRFSPLLVTVITGMIALAASAVGALIQGSNTLNLEREKFSYTQTTEKEKFDYTRTMEKEKFDASQQLEKSKQQHELVLKMISVGDESQAKRNIRFLAESGLISDQVLAKKLLDVNVTGVLPASVDNSAAGQVSSSVGSAKLLALISPAALDLIVRFETGPDYYEKNLSHPFLSGSMGSGVTIGIGYDLGYASAAKMRSDWQGLLPDDVIDRLSNAVGVVGPAAELMATQLKDITIPWNAALSQFQTRTLPPIIDQLQSSLQNFGDLPPDSAGALVALAFNRGTTTFTRTGDTNAEMREIAQLMAERRFAEIPSQIRSMKRLWPSMPGLQQRRELEATLFEKGLR